MRHGQTSRTRNARAAAPIPGTFLAERAAAPTSQNAGSLGRLPSGRPRRAQTVLALTRTRALASHDGIRFSASLRLRCATARGEATLRQASAGDVLARP